MKRLTKQILGAAVAIVLAGTGVVIAAIVWASATPQGTRWLLESAIPLSGVSFSAKKIEGRIIDHLLLTDVRVALAQQKVELDTLELRWKPMLLFAGTVAVQELVVNGMRIQNDAPPANKPPNLSWPKVSANAQLFDGRIARLRVTNLSYRSLQEQPVQVTNIDGSVTWQDSTISIIDLKGVSPFGEINGTVSVGFNQPSLTADLSVALAHPIAEMNQFSLQAGKSHGKDPEPFVGTIKIAGSADKRKLLELSGDMGMAQNAINLRRLRLTRPGQKGVITADGSLAFTTLESVLALQINVAGLDLAPELNVPTDLSGTLRFAGTLSSYRGDFTLANKAKGWQAAVVSATYKGTLEGMKLAPLNGRILDGSLAGNLDINWRDGIAMQGKISGRSLNPERLDPDWKGVVNFDASVKMASTGKAPLSGSVSGVLLGSRLHGQDLTGRLQADFAGNNLSLTRLALQGKGFGIQASGELNQRLDLHAQISDFSRLVPGSAGTLQAQGWVRMRGGLLSGAVAGVGNKLAYNGTQISSANLNARLDEGTGYPLHLAASLRDVVHGNYSLNAVTVAADGTLPHHTLNVTMRSDDAEARLTISAGYKASAWKGEISSLEGSDDTGPWNLTAPAAFAVSSGKIFISPLTLTSGGAERLEVAANLALDPLRGQLRAQWAGLNLARINPYLKDGKISGISRGTVRLGFMAGNRLNLAGSAGGSGIFTGQGGSTTIERSLVTFDGSEKGMRVGIEFDTADGGRLKGTFSSPAPLRLVMPSQGELHGELSAELSGIDLALLKPLLPPDTRVEGRISGRANGFMLPGQRLKLDGDAVLSGGVLHQKSGDGDLNLTFTSATASWGWREEALTGTLSMTMAEYGQARAKFQLPLPARFPVAVNSKGPLKASLVGQLKEKGIISDLFPGLVQKSFGELETELTIDGTWEVPVFGGKVQLSKGGAYLLTAGVHLQDVQFAAHLEKNLILIDSFRAVSGPGHIEGTALFTLADWRVTGYHGTIRGKNFQTVFLPELRILSTPEFTFEGTPQKLVLRGEVRLPELNFIGAQSRSGIAPSSDVILERRIVPLATSSPMALDVQIRVLLGEQVFVKVAGIDARLGGGMDLSFSSLDRITSRGEINVAKGRYRTYGVNLEIVRGRLFFAGGPINHPTLDVLALRTIGDVRAGVTVTGTLQKPITKLYSEPAMPDVDILAYIVLGHPLGNNSAQVSLVNQAAGALLSSSQATVLQDQIKSHLGLSTIEFQEGVGGTTSPMGYKPLQVTAPGSIPAAQQSGITESVLTVGKYLTPELYISYGRSLFTGSNLFLLRYDIFKQWQIETQTGSESGADLFYKLEFK